MVDQANPVGHGPCERRGGQQEGSVEGFSSEVEVPSSALARDLIAKLVDMRRSVVFSPLGPPPLPVYV